MLGLSKTAIFKIYGAKAMGEASNRFDEIFAWSISKIDPLLLEIAKRLKVTRAELANARGEEIVSALEKGPAESYRAELKQRIINYSLVLENGKISVHSGKSYQEYLKKESRSEKVNTKIRELHGQGVSAGKAKGRVKIVWDASEMKKVKRGDILVATSTYPALVPAMEKAGAIVTNEGGLLSHAAIVSRELGIPCVVGTKIGTKVLKDGDLVEVDANKGIVKRI
ncbi:hypothetical protein D4R52_02655 [bacterium]|nr:MAG: hypothetical protein D4R52_02655 [bacterium]